jgi:hypothetical protein
MGPRSRRPLFLAAALLTWGMVAAMRGPGASHGFPVAERLSNDRLGLFVAIDEYLDPALPDLRGAVSDMRRLERLLRTKHGFERTALIADAHATRAGIRGAFARLLEQARRRRPRLVVIAFAGHGRQTPDVAPALDENEGAYGMDETWTPHDADGRDASRDIRDDEISDAIRRLRRLGAQVVLISDSCHSGSIDDGATCAKYAACRDAQLAQEGVDPRGRYFGRYSEVVLDLLGSAPPGLTYEALHRAVAAEFERRWPSPAQRPVFAARPDMRRRCFLATRS